MLWILSQKPSKKSDPMELKEALNAAMSFPQVMSLRNYFLASVFSMIEEGGEVKEWTFMFYEPASGKVRDCVVSKNDNGNTKVKYPYKIRLEEDRPSRAEMKELRADNIKISVDDALSTAKKNYKKKSINILITLHSREKPTWTITFIGADITATSIDIDAMTGDITREESADLTRKL